MLINENIVKKMNLLKEQIGKLYSIQGAPTMSQFKYGNKITYTVKTESEHIYEIVFYFYPADKTEYSVLNYYQDGLKFIDSKTKNKKVFNVCAIWFKNISKGMNRSHETKMWEYARLYNTIVSLIKKVLRNKTSIKVIYFSGVKKKEDGTIDRENLTQMSKIYKTLALRIKPEGWEFFQFGNLITLIKKELVNEARKI